MYVQVDVCGYRDNDNDNDNNDNYDNYDNNNDNDTMHIVQVSCDRLEQQLNFKVRI